MKITLIGLGIREGDLSIRAYEAINKADEIIARTKFTRSFKSLEKFEVRTLDDIYEKSESFDDLTKNLADEVLKTAESKSVCYCVDGAVCEDEACKVILHSTSDVEICEGISKSAYAASLAKIKTSQFLAASAYDIKNVKSSEAVVIYDLDCEYIASEVKEKLTKLFGEENDCTFIRGDSAAKIKIYEIDRQKDYAYSCCVVVESCEFLKKDRYDFADLERLIKLLRAPGGCPWDREQTNESIKKNTIEEAYELVDAVERGDDDAIEEETGDVLLQAAFHAVIKEEQGVFDSTDAITRLVKKLIFRHSHIFGGDKAESGSEALGVWEKNKNIEKNMSSVGDTLLAVPKNFPACMRAQKVGKRAAKSGMDFSSSVSSSERLFDEVQELIDALVDEDKERVFDEAGDVLFSAVNTCRLAGVDCEEALQASVNKFIKRFCEVEKLLLSDGKTFKDLTELDFDYYWQRAKNEAEKN